MVLAELGGKLRDSLRRLQQGAAGASASALSSEDVAAILSDIARALIEADVNIKLVSQLRNNIQQKVEKYIADNMDSTKGGAAASAGSIRQMQQQQQLSKLVQRAVVDELTNLLKPKQPSKTKGGSSSNTAFQMKRGKSNIVLFVGLQGAGKTTTIAKFASYYQRRGWKTAMVCADTFRAGAFDQLKQNATKLRIPFYGSYTEPDPVLIAERGVKQFEKDRYELILVDTSGRHKQQAELFDEMREIAAVVHPDNTILVMDGTQGQAVYDQAKAFHETVPVGAVIITKLDGHAKGGGALSAVAATNSPVIFTGSGEHFDDMEPFHAESFVSKLLGFGDLRGLMEAMKGGDDQDDKNKQEELMQKIIQKGQFTLRDMYNQFEKILNMGPLNKLAGMIPGMPDYLSGAAGGDQEHRLRKFMVIMDSMSNAELDGKIDMHKKYDSDIEKRIRRIAAGSGTHPNEVKMLLLSHRQFESVMGKLGKSGALAGAGAGAANPKQAAQVAAQMRKNPSLIHQRLNQMDPRIIQQMGGREKALSMMQQFAQSGGFPSAGGGGGGMMPNPSNWDAMNAMFSPGGMPAGAGGAMPPNMAPGGMDMQQLMQMAQSMGMGGMMSGGGPTASGTRR
jgi:signal recognition particle subunit SRP54